MKYHSQLTQNGIIIMEKQEIELLNRLQNTRKLAKASINNINNSY